MFLCCFSKTTIWLVFQATRRTKKSTLYLGGGGSVKKLTPAMLDWTWKFHPKLGCSQASGWCPAQRAALCRVRVMGRGTMALPRLWCILGVSKPGCLKALNQSGASGMLGLNNFLPTNGFSVLTPLKVIHFWQGFAESNRECTCEMDVSM